MAARLGCTTAEVLALAILALGAIGLMGLLWWLQRPPATAERSVAAALTGSEQPSPVAGAQPAVPVPTPAAVTASATVRVHVTGQVTAPGVYEIDGDARVIDALTAAGGPTADADLEAVNLAQPLADGLQIRVPAPGETLPPAAAAPLVGAPADGGPLVDLNRADAAALEALPGVGPVTAQRILEHRARIGGFRSVEELLDVSGIGEATLADLVHRVTVGP